MKTILILTAMPEEMAYLTQRFPTPQTEHIYHLEFQKVAHQELKIIMGISGIGKVNAAVCTTLACQTYKPDIVVNIGASGGLHRSLKIGDVVIASALQHHDANATQFGYAYGQIPRMPVCYVPDEVLMKKVLAQKSQFAFNLFSGLVCSGDSFISDEALVIELKSKFPEIFALDMESCAVAQTCHQLGIEFCCIRGISDAATKGADQDYKTALSLAMGNANQVLGKFLELL